MIFKHIGSSDTLIASMMCTISAYLKLMLYEGNDFPSFYSTKIKWKQYLPCKS